MDILKPNEAVVEEYLKWQREYFAAENARWKAEDRAGWKSTFFFLALSAAVGLLVTACNLSLAFYHGTFPFAN